MDNITDTDVDLHSHCFNVSVIAHLLAEIDNKLFNKKHNAERVALLGLYHEYAEGVSGDISAPVKYSSPIIAKEIKAMEEQIERRCAASLPEPLQAIFASFIVQSEVEPEYKAIVKAADDLVAYFKCEEEVEKSKNVDFADAVVNLREKVDKHSGNMPCVKWFLNNFESGYVRTIDELMKG
jgi:5'-deoxynucleotidase